MTNDDDACVRVCGVTLSLSLSRLVLKIFWTESSSLYFFNGSAERVGGWVLLHDRPSGFYVMHPGIYVIIYSGAELDGGRHFLATHSKYYRVVACSCHFVRTVQ